MAMMPEPTDRCELCGGSHAVTHVDIGFPDNGKILSAVVCADCSYELGNIPQVARAIIIERIRQDGQWVDPSLSLNELIQKI
jgi:hypothetical protein